MKDNQYDPIPKDYKEGYEDGYNRGKQEKERRTQCPTIETKEKTKKGKDKNEEKKSNYQFFQNKSCEYFPCHTGIKAKDFSCLFCFCPIYETCIDRKHKTWLCKTCTFFHKKDNYKQIMTLLHYQSK